MQNPVGYQFTLRGQDEHRDHVTGGHQPEHGGLAGPAVDQPDQGDQSNLDVSLMCIKVARTTTAR